MLSCCRGGCCLSGGGPSAVPSGFFFCWPYHIFAQALLGIHLSYAGRVWFQVRAKGSFIQAFFLSFLAKLRWVEFWLSGYYKGVSSLQKGFLLALQVCFCNRYWALSLLAVTSGNFETIACLLDWSVLVGLHPLGSSSLLVKSTWPGVIWLKSWTLSGLWMLALHHSCGVCVVSYRHPVVLHNIS